MKKELFLLEDDLQLSETVCEFLEGEGYSVVACYDGNEAQSLLYEKRYDLLLLDVNVPGIKGFALLKELRASGTTTPAIFLTSLNALEDVEHGYESGCDDYLRKPFALKELLLRIETLLKREFFHAPHSSLRIAEGITWDVQTLTLSMGGAKCHLHQKEAKLLQLLLQKRHTIVTHQMIVSHLWEYDEVGSDDVIRTYIKNLRKLIGKERIVSFKKLGYQFTGE